jgi:hypothetical protein
MKNYQRICKTFFNDIKAKLKYLTYSSIMQDHTIESQQPQLESQLEPQLEQAYNERYLNRNPRKERQPVLELVERYHYGTIADYDAHRKEIQKITDTLFIYGVSEMVQEYLYSPSRCDMCDMKIDNDTSYCSTRCASMLIDLWEIRTED